MLRRSERAGGRLRSGRGPCRANRSALWAFLLSGCVFILGTPVLRAQAKTNMCLDCHSKFDPPFGINEAEFSGSIHPRKGLACTSCHGGDSSSADMTQAMGKAAGFKGHIDRAQIPALCGKCHSDAAYMRGFNPSVRTDQFSQYQTSVHGKRLAKGDTHVAVCTDCHTVHNIRPPNDPLSSVYPVNVAQTCAHCHADAEYMKDFKIPTNQFALYSTSVHHDALTVQGDLSAPTCSTCHGSHGAAPPGVASVERVCSTCHVFQTQMYEKSSHLKAFEAASLPGCIVCHGNHGISHPTDAKLGTGPESACMRCHSAGDACDQARAEMLNGLNRLNGAITDADRVLAKGESSGVEVSDARLEQDQARDSLTKARVTIHSFQKELVEQDIQGGLKITQKTRQAGLAAIAESKKRRTGLAVSLLAIVLVLIALALLIRRMESGEKA
jgi:hypothetical protein